MDTEYTIHVVSNYSLWNRAVIEPVAGLVNCSNQKVLEELQASASTNEFMETDSGNNENCLVIVSLQQKSMSATPPLLNTSSNDEAEDCKERWKRKSK